MTGLDHGELNIPLAKRYGKGGIDAALDRHLGAERKAKTAESKARRAAAREAEAARPKLSRGDVEGARVVRDGYGWHKVIRVNAKSVTVATGYSWTERIAFDRIVEVRQ